MSHMSTLILTLLAAATMAQTPTPDAQAIRACAAGMGTEPTVSGVTVVPFEATADELAGFRVTHVRSGAWMNVFHDEVSRPAAAARAACLGAQLPLLAEEVGDTRRGVEWSGVVFWDNAEPYVGASRGAGGVTRWTVTTRPDGHLTEGAQEMVVAVLPHEQTHAYQLRTGAQSPRWFHEGHANWVGLRVLARLDPVLADKERAKQDDILARSEVPLNLAGWGGMRVKPEAILRQLSPEDRHRQLTDPTFQPSGSFRFGPDDLISDESNTPARYAGAWKVFVGLEQRHGADAVRAWVNEVTDTSGNVTGEALAQSVRDRFGEDLDVLLADAAR